MRSPFDAVARPLYRHLRRGLGYLLFERPSRIDTSGDVWLGTYGLNTPERVGYVPSGWLTLRRALPPREVTPDDVFLDLGSGKGRIVYLAARSYRFKRVIGVELVPELNDLARENIRRVQDRLLCRTVELVTQDVVDYEIPDDVTVVYLFHPFKGSVFERVVDRLVQSVDENPREVRIIYLNPHDENVDRLLATGRVQLARRIRGWRPGREWSRSNSTHLYVLR